ELFAQAIHAASPRGAGPFHAINCGALAPALLEAELFGYAPGAFTGADRDGRTGLFHAASGGTLFLDEVAEMSAAMQAALLRALVATGGFRQDLYYRLKGALVRIAPLRERTDTVALARHLLGDVGLSAGAAEAIARYAWPGNVRELKSVLAVARIVAAGAGEL